MRRFIFILTTLLAFSQLCLAGPFGFEMGMSKEQLVAKLGKDHLKKVEGDVLVFDTAPAPHPSFDEYMIVVSPTAGLVKIMAFTPNFECNDSGDQVKSKFGSLHDALASKYGDAKVYDYVKSSSIWKEPGDWMMGLLKEDRTLASYWLTDDKKAVRLPDNLTAISLSATARSRNSAYIALGYEFEGWQKYIDKKKEKQNSVF